jgi:hypothetical protein
MSAKNESTIRPKPSETSGDLNNHAERSDNGKPQSLLEVMRRASEDARVEISEAVTRELKHRRE